MEGGKGRKKEEERGREVEGGRDGEDKERGRKREGRRSEKFSYNCEEFCSLQTAVWL